MSLHIESLGNRKKNIKEDLKNLRGQIEAVRVEADKADKLPNTTAAEQAARKAEQQKVLTTLKTTHEAVKANVAKWRIDFAGHPDSLKEIDEFDEWFTTEVGKTVAGNLLDQVDALKRKTEYEGKKDNDPTDTTIVDATEAATPKKVSDILTAEQLAAKEANPIGGWIQRTRMLMSAYTGMMKMVANMMKIKCMGDAACIEKQDNEIARLEAQYEQFHGPADLRDSFNDHLEDKNITVREGGLDVDAFASFKTLLKKQQQTSPNMTRDTLVAQIAQEYAAGFLAGGVTEHETTLIAILKGEETIANETIDLASDQEQEIEVAGGVTKHMIAIEGRILSINGKKWRLEGKGALAKKKVEFSYASFKNKAGKKKLSYGIGEKSFIPKIFGSISSSFNFESDGTPNGDLEKHLKVLDAHNATMTVASGKTKSFMGEGKDYSIELVPA